MRKGKKKPKYKNTTYASHGEVWFAKSLNNLKIKWEYEPESFLWNPPAQKYTPDFKIYRANGKPLYVEYKGYLRPMDKVKMVQMKKQRPDVDIRFVFQKADKPMAGSRPRKDGTRLTHAEWAEKHGYLWAERFIPKEWLLED